MSCVDEYYDEDWEVLRKNRLDFDEYTCQDCGYEADQVHHLNYPAIDIDDCISLCVECHSRRHNKSTLEMLEMYNYTIRNNDCDCEGPVRSFPKPLQRKPRRIPKKISYKEQISSRNLNEFIDSNMEEIL